MKFATTPDKELENVMKDWLKYAGDRNVKKLKKNNENIVSNNIQ